MSTNAIGAVSNYDYKPQQSSGTDVAAVVADRGQTGQVPPTPKTDVAAVLAFGQLPPQENCRDLAMC